MPSSTQIQRNFSSNFFLFYQFLSQLGVSLPSSGIRCGPPSLVTPLHQFTYFLNNFIDGWCWIRTEIYTKKIKIRPTINCLIRKFQSSSTYRLPNSNLNQSMICKINCYSITFNYLGNFGAHNSISQLLLIMVLKKAGCMKILYSEYSSERHFKIRSVSTTRLSNNSLVCTTSNLLKREFAATSRTVLAAVDTNLSRSKFLSITKNSLIEHEGS